MTLDINRLTQVLLAITRQTDKNLEAHSLTALFLIAEAGEEGTTVHELQAKMPSVPPSALARTLQRLGEGAQSSSVKNVGQALHLVERWPDPDEVRRYRYALSERGKAIFQKQGLVD